MNKKGNSWILCPSKTFPGKLYYFNVVTGEAAWCLTEEEKKAAAKDFNIKKVCDKINSYPEPNTPPTEDVQDVTNMCYNFNPPPNMSLNYQMGPPHIFEHPVFSRYIPSQYMPGYMIPMPQMFVPNKVEPKKRSYDQITQTSDDNFTSVHGYTIPLTERFETYRQANINTKTIENKVKYSSTQNKSNIFTLNKDNLCKTGSWGVNTGTLQGSIFVPKLFNHNENEESMTKQNYYNFNVNNAIKTCNSKIIRDPILTSIGIRENNNCHNFNYNNSKEMPEPIQKSIFVWGTEKKPERNQQVIANLDMNTLKEYSLKKATSITQKVFNENWFHNSKCHYIPKEPMQTSSLDFGLISSLNEIKDTEDVIDNEEIKLNKNDLRFILQAKRKKLKPYLGTTLETKGKFPLSPQVSKNNMNALKEKKQVTFDLQNLGKDTPSIEESEMQLPNSDFIIESNSPTSQVINISYLKSLARPFLKTDPWYVVVGIGVLLDDFEFIEDFVKQDITCRLLVPNSVRSYIETMSVGEYGGRSWVMMARKAMRRLTTREQHVVLQPSIMENRSTSTIDGTIECCLQALECNHAVLITTDAELYSKGVSSGVCTFKLDDIKRSVESEPELSFNMGTNIKVNDNNIFMQNTDNFNNFALSKEDLSMNDSYIFKIPTTVRKNHGCIPERNKVGAKNPGLFDKSNIITVTTSTDKNKLGCWKINLNKQHSNIEDDIKLLSLHENTAPNNKLSDNLKGISKKYQDLKLRKVIINTNIQNNDDKNGKDTQNMKFEHRHRILEHVSNISKYGFKVEPLTITAPVKLQNTNSSMKEVHRVKINAYTMDDSLKRFHVKDVGVNQRIESRIEEWICCFYQIMEECLSYILMNNTRDTLKKLSAPWTLLEAVICLKEVYCDDTAIKSIADKFSTVLSNLSDKHDILMNRIKSVDFMKLFGCGVLLVESLKSMLPQSAQVVESEELLNKLWHRMQDPSHDIELPYTPIRVLKGEMDDMDCLNRNIVLKKPSEIIGYLKKHFPAWKDFDQTQLSPEFTKVQKKNLLKDKTILRTFGKNLNTIRINNAKKITFDNTPLYNTPECKENIEIKGLKDMPLITRTVNTHNDTEKVNVKDKSSCNINKNNNSLANGRNNNTKLIKNHTKWKNSLEDESLDYEEFLLDNDKVANDVIIKYDDNAIPFIDDEMKQSNDAVYNEIPLFVAEGNDRTARDDNCNNSTNDSGFVNQSLDACSFIRLFLRELSESFKLIYNFIDDSIQEFRCDVIRRHDKKLLYDKANETHLYIVDIIGKLKRIVEREASGNSKLKSLIINAGIEALADKRMTRYRQVIMKCLEQAQLLEAALKTMLALTNEQCDITAVQLDDVDGHVPYFNIFE